MKIHGVYAFDYSWFDCESKAETFEKWFFCVIIMNKHTHTIHLHLQYIRICACVTGMVIRLWIVDDVYWHNFSFVEDYNLECQPKERQTKTKPKMNK